MNKLFSPKIKIKNRIDVFFDLTKLTIIVLMSIFLILNFFPFYYGSDSLLYGATGVNLAKGTYGFSNELLKESGSLDFVPPQWKITVHNTAIPLGSVGIYVLSAFSFMLGGYYGLFYLSPIFTILLLIFSERIATNLFGKLAGLLTLVIISADFMIIRFVGSRLLTDNIFAVFFILGCFFLIKYSRQNQNTDIFLCSIFFATSALFRLNGLLFFPIEILLIVGLIIFQRFKNNSKSKFNQKIFITKKSFQKLKLKSISKTIFFFILPWIIFFIIFFSYNTYFFGDPLTTYLSAGGSPEYQEKNRLFLLFQFDSDRFEKYQFWSVGLLPDQFKSAVIELYSSNTQNLEEKNWLSIFLIIFLISILIISFYSRKNRKEVIIFVIIISATLFVYSSSFVNFPFKEGIQERHMIFNFLLISMLFGFVIQRVSEINFSRYFKNHSKIIPKGFQCLGIVILILFIFGTFYYSPVGEAIKSEKTFYDPLKKAQRLPIPEVLSKDDIVVDARGRYTIEQNAIPFHPYKGIDLKNNQEPFPQKPIEKLKNLNEDGYDIFVFKKKYDIDACYFRYLEYTHGIILKEYSGGICKVIFPNSMMNITVDKEDTESDSICYKGWDRQVKPKWEDTKKTRNC